MKDDRRAPNPRLAAVVVWAKIGESQHETLNLRPRQDRGFLFAGLTRGGGPRPLPRLCRDAGSGGTRRMCGVTDGSVLRRCTARAAQPTSSLVGDWLILITPRSNSVDCEAWHGKWCRTDPSGPPLRLAAELTERNPVCWQCEAFIALYWQQQESKDASHTEMAHGGTAAPQPR